MLWLSGLPDNDLAQYLSKQIVRAISDGLLTGLDVPARLWDVNLENNFHRIISLMKNPAVLGQELLNASLQLQDPEAVEILIRAHDCYTVACNVEGIGLVLRRARVLAMQILQTHQRRLLVRLLVGIGRYGDMGYIFQMLKVNDQFEFLLRKKTAQVCFVGFGELINSEGFSGAWFVDCCFGVSSANVSRGQETGENGSSRFRTPRASSCHLARRGR